MHLFQRLVAQAALGRVEDPLERQIVRRLVDDAQVRECIADFGALVEAKTPDDAIGHADGDEPVLELARLELGAHQDRGPVQADPAPRQAFQLLADPPRLFRAIPDAKHAHLLARIDLGPQRLAESVAVRRDQPRGRAQDVRGGAVVLLEPDDPRAGKILFEAQDIGDLRPAPRIDRLVVIADAADILARLGEQPQPEILAGIGVLIFVDQDIFELLLILLEHRAVGAQ